MENKQKNAVVLSEQDQYTMLHNEILQYGSMATTCYVQFMAKLKAMRDGKLYKAVGIESFGEYVEQQIGIGERQAYKYITAYENLSQEFLNSSSKIGITKLALLASLDEGERQELMEEIDVESATVKELKQAIAEREQQIEEQAHELQELDKLLGKKNQQMEAITAERNEQKQRADSLEQQKKDWQTFAEEKQQMTEQINRAEQEKQKLQQEIEALKSAPVKVETVDNPETVKELEAAQKRIEELVAEQRDLEAKQKELAKKLEVANDETMSRFKRKFDDLQLIGQEILGLLSTMNDDKAASCKKALKAVVGGWQL